MRDQIEDQIIQWNVKFPLDRKYRKEKNILFGSLEHRQINQIDLFLQFKEDKVYDRILKEIKENKKESEALEKGKWLKEESDNKKEDDDLFSKLDIGEASGVKITE